MCMPPTPVHVHVYEHVRACLCALVHARARAHTHSACDRGEEQHRPVQDIEDKNKENEAKLH